MTDRQWTVGWLPDLTTAFAEAWNRAAPELRRELAALANRIDSVLSRHPERVGHPPAIESSIRIDRLVSKHFTPHVQYQIISEDRQVHVLLIQIRPSRRLAP